MNDKQKTCEERVEEELQSRIADLSQLWQSYSNEETEELGSLYDYGLSYDYVAPFTFKDQEVGYFRYQLSWGGPSDEFRIYAREGRHGWEPYRIEYWFLDWFDGARRVLYGEEYDLIEELFTSFFDCSNDSVYEEAMKDWEPPEDYSSSS